MEFDPRQSPNDCSERVRKLFAEISKQSKDRPFQQAMTIAEEIEKHEVPRIADATERHNVLMELSQLLFYESIRRECPQRVCAEQFESLCKRGFLHISYEIGAYITFEHVFGLWRTRDEALQDIADLHKRLETADLNPDVKKNELESLAQLRQRVEQRWPS